MANVSFNPALTTAPQNTFLQSTEGYVQGAFFDDPSSRMWLASGVVGSAVAQPVWGGMAITEEIAAVNGNAMGNKLILATTQANLTGFTVFNQANNMIIVPGNSVQIATPSMTTNFFRVGSNARIAVQCSSDLASALSGGAINQQVAWDFTNQALIAYASGTALPAKILSFNTNSKIVSYNSGTGAVSWTTGAAAIIQI